MSDELITLEYNKTWTVIDLPRGKVVIACKYVYKTKFHANGSIERLKAQLVDKGFSQQAGIDYIETFSPVAKLVTFRVLLFVIAINGWSFLQFDVNNAFLHGDLEEEIYMHKPPSYFISGFNQVYKFFKSLYGLKQASRKGIHLSQRKYALDILADSGTLARKPLKLSFEQNFKLSKTSGVPLSDPSTYRRLIGHLLYLTIIKPNICYLVQILSQYIDTPMTTHLATAHRILHYIKQSVKGYCIFLSNSLISWKFKKQSIVSHSLAETEYQSMASTCSELTWLRYLLQDLHVSHPQATQLYYDNQAALHIAANLVFHERTKHIELDFRAIRDKIQDSSITTR
ncbi:PREDICTED: uncharacterized protein LOC105111176 [Populus euphratica]|uniref:Uncharacterized protein LOC105111176 n=1 Tax=Populus euphratica TaxID=75702 RepID=A0AAJ6T5U4_POPEU|nr:PREDICTED: uncharacterized protein LOC105111176 [Populus euphratica]